MARNILVATPQPAFGELLRLSLEESGRYRVRLVQTGREALASAEHIVFSLAILDSALSGPPFPYVAQGLRTRCPDVRLLVIPPPEGSTAPAIREVKADGYVDQPFYAPSLLETIDHLTADAPQPVLETVPVAVKQADPTTLEANQATAILEEFLKDSSAPAVMILRSRQPWVSAGQFNAEALNEVSGLLARYIDAKEGVDLARFVHLQSVGDEYLVYASPLPQERVLVMVYQVATPLTIIRSQSGRLARLLREPPPSATPALVQAANQDPAPDDSETDDAQLEAEAMRLVDLLSEMPAPNPVLNPNGGDWVPENSEHTPEPDSFLFPWEREDAHNATAVTQAVAMTQTPAAALDIKEHAPDGSKPWMDAAGELVDTTPDSVTQAVLTRSNAPTMPIAPNGQDLNASIEDTQPVVLRTLQSIQQAEPIGSALSNLAYTCVLIPRLPTHALVNQLAERLTEWLPQLCLAYGWRMEGLLIRPEYLQWTVQVAPAISPGNVIRLIRQQSSRRIFIQFPKYEVENPSGDFWAPGFLIISGFQPPSLQLVLDFIHQTRTRQSPWLH